MIFFSWYVPTFNLLASKLFKQIKVSDLLNGFMKIRLRMTDSVAPDFNPGSESITASVSAVRYGRYACCLYRFMSRTICTKPSPQIHLMRCIVPKGTQMEVGLALPRIKIRGYNIGYT